MTGNEETLLKIAAIFRLILNLCYYACMNGNSWAYVEALLKTYAH